MNNPAVEKPNQNFFPHPANIDKDELLYIFDPKS